MAAAEVLGTLTSQKEPFSHSDMSTIYSKSQWKFKITIELTFMDNIKHEKNTAKRMIDFLPVTWKCCFYSAHFQPGGLFEDTVFCWSKAPSIRFPSECRLLQGGDLCGSESGDFNENKVFFHAIYSFLGKHKLSIIIIIYFFKYCKYSSHSSTIVVLLLVFVFLKSLSW